MAKISPNSTPNLVELGKVIRDMQADSLAKHKAANNFNELGAAIVQHGIEDKQRSRGWPVTPTAPEPVEKKTL
jgi:hypothetical protein